MPATAQTRVTGRPLRSQDRVGGAMQVGAGHRSAEVPNARRCRRQWCPQRTKERELQARPIHRGGGCHPPLASRGYRIASQGTDGAELALAAWPRNASDSRPELEVTLQALGGRRRLDWFQEWRMTMRSLARCSVGTSAASCRGRRIARCGCGTRRRGPDRYWTVIVFLLP
jgi:hypothetical protein